MTAEEFAQVLDERIARLRDGFPLCVNAAHADMVERIFERGERAGGGAIGEYDTTSELYVNRDHLPRAAPAKGKRGKPIKSAYFESYAELRQQQGRESGFINFVLTGELQNDFATSLQPHGDNWITGTNKPVNTEKLEGLEARFGDDIFRLSDSEREGLRRCAQESGVKIMSGHD